MEARAGALNAQCQGDKDLRDFVERLLAKHDAATSGLLRTGMCGADPRLGQGGPAAGARDPSTSDAAKSQTRTSSESPAGVRMPQRIGRYRLKRTIASGGMGTVYEAMQDQPRRTVAVKVMKYGIASRSALRRFEYEAQILARLRHPGIAQVFEAGTHTDAAAEVPYFAMEYIPNARSLTGFANEKKLGTRERLALFAQVCDAVHHGHQKGIIHRDLKPSNILVDSAGQVKIIDFGVAKATDSDMAITTLQTDVGQLIGTLQYMSPEQCDADPNDLDTRSDVYALGVVFYELIAGRLPYDIRRAAIHEATRVIREEQPTRLSTINRALRGEVEIIALRALEKERERRYQSATDFGQDIQRYLNHEPITARRASVLYQMRVFARRNRVVFGAMAAVFVILVGATIVSTLMYFRADAQRRRAVAAEILAGEEATRASEEAARASKAREEESEQRTLAERSAESSMAMYQFLMWGLGFANPAKAAGKELTVREMLDLAAANIGERFVDHPGREATVRHAIGAAYHQIAQHEAAVEQLTRSQALQKRLYGPRHEGLVDTLLLLGLTSRESLHGEAQAERWLQESAEVSIHLLARKYPELGQTLADMKRDLVSFRRPSDPQIATHVERVLQAYGRAMAPDHPDGRLVMTVVSAALTYVSTMHRGLDATFSAWSRLLPIARNLYADDPGTLGRYLFFQVYGPPSASPLSRNERVALARERLDLVKSYHPRPGAVDAAGGLLGKCLTERGRPSDLDEAEPLLIRGFEAQLESYGGIHWRSSAALGRLMDLYVTHRGEVPREFVTTLARSTMVTPPEWAAVVLGRDWPEAAAAIRRAESAIKARRGEDIAPLLKAVLVEGQAIPEDDSLTVIYADALNRLGHHGRKRGIPESLAEEIHRAALTIWQRQLPADNVKIRWGLIYVTGCLVRMGRYAESELFSRELLEQSNQQEPAGTHIGGLAHMYLGRALAKQGRFEEAAPLAVRGYDLILAARGENVNTPRAHRYLCDLYATWPQARVPAELAVRLASSNKSFLTPGFAVATLKPRWPDIAEGLRRLNAAANERRTADIESLTDRLLTIGKNLRPDEPLVLVYADALNRVSHVLMNTTTDWNACIRLDNAALDIWQRVLPEQHAKIRWGQLYLSESYLSAERFDEAEQVVRRGLALSDLYDAPTDSIAGLMRGQLGHALMGQTRFEDARRWVEAGFAVLMAGEGPRSGNVQELRRALINLYVQAGELEAACDLLVNAGSAGTADWPQVQHVFSARYPQLAAAMAELQGLLERATPDQPVDVAQAWASVNSAQQSSFGFTDKAAAVYAEVIYDWAQAFARKRLSSDAPAETLPMFRDVLAIQRHHLAPDHPKIRASLWKVAMNLTNLGRPAEALPVYIEYTEIARKGNNAWNVANGGRRIGWCLSQIGRFEEAEEHLLRSLGFFNNYYGERVKYGKDDFVQLTLAALSDLYTRWDQPERLHNLYPSQVAHHRRLARHADASAQNMNDYAWALLTCEREDLRDPDEALPFAEKAVAATDGADPAVLDTLAVALHMTGNFDRAIEIEQKAISLVPADQPQLRAALEQTLQRFLDEGASRQAELP